jgi:hypothetical protein
MQEIFSAATVTALGKPENSPVLQRWELWIPKGV